MPCYDSRDREFDEDCRKGATLLCEFCKELEDAGYEVPSRFKQWWIQHKKMDKEHRL